MPSHRGRTPQAGYLGDLPPGVWIVLEEAFRGGFMVSSNFSRQWSTEVALAASIGWISTVSLDGKAYGRNWLCTLAGVAVLREHYRSQNDA